MVRYRLGASKSDYIKMRCVAISCHNFWGKKTWSIVCIWRWYMDIMLSSFTLYFSVFLAVEKFDIFRKIPLKRSHVRLVYLFFIDILFILFIPYTVDHVYVYLCFECLWYTMHSYTQQSDCTRWNVTWNWELVVRAKHKIFYKIFQKRKPEEIFFNRKRMRQKNDCFATRYLMRNRGGVDIFILCA